MIIIAGLGGAFISMPLLLSAIFKLGQHAASGTTIIVAVSTSIGACFAYTSSKEGDNLIDMNSILRTGHWGNVDVAAGIALIL